jgi:translation initiation factor IF-2
LGFNSKISATAQALTETEKVLARTYRIIYELLDELTDAANGMLVPIEVEEMLGKGSVIAEFPFEKMRVCGTRVSEGRFAKNDMIKIVRAGIEENEGIVGRSKIKSIRVGKDESNKVEKGKECGIFLDPQVDFRIGDDIISYRLK